MPHFQQPKMIEHHGEKIVRTIFAGNSVWHLAADVAPLHASLPDRYVVCHPLGAFIAFENGKEVARFFDDDPPSARVGWRGGHAKSFDWLVRVQ